MEVRQFGKYTLLEHMGKGGVASVFRASDGDSGRITAVKIFESGPEREPELSLQLRDREVKMLVSVQHPNIVTFFEAGQAGDDVYYSMEFVENSLLKVMRNGPELELVDKVHVLRQTASALVAIHRQGIVHRDIKPGNILLGQDPNGAIHVKLTDLGIARGVSEVDIVRERPSTRVAGTARYLSPEQIRRDPMDGRSDVFSLGVLAYELVAGARPFEAENSKAYLTANIEQDPTPVHEVAPDVPLFLGQIIERMLAKDREDRYDSETLARDLELAEQHLISGAPLVETANAGSLFYEATEADTWEEWPVEPPPTTTPLSKAAALAIVVAGAVVVAVLWPRVANVRDAPPPPAPSTPVDAASPVEQVRAAAEAGRHWQALVLFEDLTPDGLPESDQLALTELHLRAQEALAEDSYRAAHAMLGEDREVEAEIVLDRMETLFPDAGQTRRLAAEIGGRRQQALRDQQWQRRFAETYELVSKRRYRDALAARKKLLEDYAADPDRAETARRAIGDLLEQWAEDLIQRTPDVDATNSFLDTARLEGDIFPDRPSPRVLGELRLQLAEAHRARAEYGPALEQYRQAARVADPDVARRGQAKAEELRRWLTERPQNVTDVAAELEQNGFASSVWQGGSDAGGGQQLVGGTLRLRSPESGWESVAYVETVRPIRHRGFSAGFTFKVTPAMLERPRSSRVGIEVTGGEENVFEFAFDGGDYTIRTKVHNISAKGTVRSALGDEDSAWRTLAVRYDFNSRQLAVLLDGEELRTYPLELSEFRLRIFLAAPADRRAGADVRDVFCRPSPRSQSASRPS